MREFLLLRILNLGSKWSSLLEVGIKLAREEICNASIPITLLSDLIELSSLQKCEQIFAYVEDRLEVWKEPFFLNSGKNAVLRMCNGKVKLREMMVKCDSTKLFCRLIFFLIFMIVILYTFHFC
jgi:THO complex subunit 1